MVGIKQGIDQLLCESDYAFDRDSMTRRHVRRVIGQPEERLRRG
jgi:hypothetical protein